MVPKSKQSPTSLTLCGGLDLEAVFCFVLACQLDQSCSHSRLLAQSEKEREDKEETPPLLLTLFFFVLSCLSPRLCLSVLFDPHSQFAQQSDCGPVGLLPPPVKAFGTLS